MIRACVKGDKLERAKSLIQVVKAKGLLLDSYFYTAAMEASDWSSAIKLLHEMEANGIPPTEVSYSVTIKACGKSGQWEKALDLLEVMRSKKMKINIFEVFIRKMHRKNNIRVSKRQNSEGFETHNITTGPSSHFYVSVGITCFR